MTPVAITLANGREVTFDLPDAGDGPPLFALSIRKCGSSIFNSMALALGEDNGCGYIDMGGAFFSKNIRLGDWQRDPALPDLIRPGILYGGFRNMPIALESSALFITSPKILFVRDPRDALVSDYFSTALTHPVPEPVDGYDDTAVLHTARREKATNSSIDEWVLAEAWNFNMTMTAYARTVKMPTTKVFRYEDFIFDKASLLRATAAQYGWEATQERIDWILQWADVRPNQEDQQNFIRKVTPGDHKDKLERKTIRSLNRTLRPAMKLYGY